MRGGRMEISAYDIVYCGGCRAPSMMWELDGVLVSNDIIVADVMGVVGECPYCSYLIYVEDL